MASKQPVYVDELFGTIEEGTNGKRWFVIYTKSQHEKKLATWAKEHNIEYYLPQIEKEHIYQYKKVKFTKPMFTGYFFTKATLKEKDTLVISGHCVNFLKVDHEPSFVKDLKRIALARDNKLVINEHPYLESGMLVRFKAGPLEGQYGLVENAENLEKVILQIKIMRNAVSVETKACDVEVIRPYDSEHDDME